MKSLDNNMAEQSNHKVIDLDRSIYEICTEYPEMIQIMVELGFQDITRPGMLRSAGRIMTLNKGAALRKIDPATIRQKLADHGFTVSDN